VLDNAHSLMRNKDVRYHVRTVGLFEDEDVGAGAADSGGVSTGSGAAAAAGAAEGKAEATAAGEPGAGEAKA
jgi:hypothetical protein